MSNTNPRHDKIPLIFLHLPRTGGTTLQTLLKKQFASDELVRIHHRQELERLHSLPAVEKKRLRFLSGHIGFAADVAIPPPVHYITFLRDQVARVASAYQLIRTNPAHTHHHVVTSRQLLLQEFVRERISVINIDNGMTRLSSGEPNDAQNVEFGQCTTAMLEAAKHSLRKRIALVGLTEQFDASLVFMRRRFGWKSPVYKILNATKSAQAAFEPADVKLIEQHNQLDRELYTFATKLFRRQWLMAMSAILYQERYFQHKNRLYHQDPPAFQELERLEYKRIARWLDLK